MIDYLKFKHAKFTNMTEPDEIICLYVFYSHLENSLLLYLAISASCILTEPIFIYCNCLTISVSYPQVN